MLLGGAGDDVLIGGPGIDVLDGGGDDDVVIQLVASETVASATAADKDWLATHARIVDGKTVLDVGGKKQTLPRADLSQLIRARRGLIPERSTHQPAPEPPGSGAGWLYSTR